ncbi:MAG: LLM class flavin-dependent oxidoreductase [Chloroflexi bacterium]|nr:LLM class flavin-dependent oxidoreductase [Chloroflexota bacterium]
MKIDFGVRLGKTLSFQEIIREVQSAERQGFTHTNCGDLPWLNRDPHIILAAMAMNTKTICLGQAVTYSSIYHPVVMANITATINQLSGGRMYLGLGSGMKLGKMLTPQPIEEVRDTILFFKNFVSGKPAEWKGATMKSGWIKNQNIPVYLAAEGPKMLEMAGELADGVITLGFHPELIKWKMELVAKGAQKAGRDPSTVDYWARGMVYVTDSVEKARREVTPYPALYARISELLTSGVPEYAALRSRLNESEHGLAEKLIADSAKVAKKWEPEWFEVIDAPFSKVVSDRLIDFFHLVGTPQYLRQRVEEIGKLGVKTISVWHGTVVEQERRRQDIADHLIRYFKK